jgi:hypothetical protein
MRSWSGLETAWKSRAGTAMMSAVRAKADITMGDEPFGFLTHLRHQRDNLKPMYH